MATFFKHWSEDEEMYSGRATMSPQDAIAVKTASEVTYDEWNAAAHSMYHAHIKGKDVRPLWSDSSIRKLWIDVAKRRHPKLRKTFLDEQKT